MPAQPIRTCVACGRKSSKADFIRIGKLPDGGAGLVSDGRGAYLCVSAPCIEKAFKRKLLSRTLRTTDAVHTETLKERILEKLTP